MKPAIDANLRPSLPHPRAFLAPLVLAPHDLSASVAHANNIAMAGWVDRLAELHADANGVSRAAQVAAGRVWFVARHEIDYLAEVFFGDDLIGATWIASIRRTTLIRQCAVYRHHASSGQFRQVLASTSRWAYIDLATRKPVAMPTPWLEWLDPLS